MGQKLFFLLIDDEHITNFYNSAIIRRCFPDAEIKFFQDAIEALSFLETETENRPNLIFLDINMPMMNGWEFIEEFTKKAYPIPVCILSSSKNPDDIERYEKQKELIDYLVKPLTKEMLIPLVSNQLKKLSPNKYV